LHYACVAASRVTADAGQLRDCSSCIECHPAVPHLPYLTAPVPCCLTTACRFGSLHVALLCAGIGERGDFLNPDHSTESLEKTLDVDLTAVITGTRSIAQAMITAGQGGRIISIASAAGGWRKTVQGSTSAY
jgi:NAD(P)-dependent dehydrogenase (short-subunit alcohol dehydrogenase family)